MKNRRLLTLLFIISLSAVLAGCTLTDTTENTSADVSTTTVVSSQETSEEEYVGDSEVESIEDSEEVVVEDIEEPTSEVSGVSYSTNDKNSVKDGNKGVYAYKSSGAYDIYYIIDFDEGYVYRFVEGNGDAGCDKVKIVSGDLNSYVLITYHDGGDSWSYALRFKFKNQPDHMVLQDEDGFENDFRTTDLEDALKIRDGKTMYEY